MYSNFQTLGVDIIGVSFDAPAKNQTFKDNQSFPYELWSDTNKELAKYYGANGGLFGAKRVTRILDNDGTLLVEYNNVDATLQAHVSNVLEDCTVIFGE
jgi:thioredoxin-dependent peroxiredoxin